MNPTTVHSSEIVGQLVLIETDPIRQRVKRAIAGFLTGCSGTTLERLVGDLKLMEAAIRRPIRAPGSCTSVPGQRPTGPVGVRTALILATVAVAPAGTEHSLVTWHTAVEPSELAEMFAPIYREGLENLKSMLEG